VTVAASPEAQRQLTQGKALVTGGKYEEGIATLARLVGTPLEAEAQELRQKAIDQHVQQVRERIARDYVRAQQLKTDGEKVTLLGTLYQTLKGTLEAYPETTLRIKAEHNLKVIEQELRKLDPTWFDRHAPAKTTGGEPAGGKTP